MIKPGEYKTERGSIVKVRKHGGLLINFDWFEEDNACCDCKICHELTYSEEEGFRISWECDYCKGGSARLIEVPEGAE